MNATAEIKNYLHQMIVETNDLVILEQIKTLFQSLNKGLEETEIPGSHKEIVRERLEDVKVGKMETISWDKLKKDIEEEHGL